MTVFLQLADGEDFTAINADQITAITLAKTYPAQRTVKYGVKIETTTETHFLSRQLFDTTEDAQSFCETIIKAILNSGPNSLIIIEDIEKPLGWWGDKPRRNPGDTPHA